MRILLIEDDAEVAANLWEFFQAQGATIDWARDGLTGLHRVAAERFDIVLLDLGLPGLDGLDLARSIRQSSRSALPIIMLTARDTLQNKLDGFAAGADDYLVKPFSLAELGARVSALIARASGQLDRDGLCVGDLHFNPDSLQAERSGRALTLTRPGFTLLECLMRETRRVVRRAELEHLLWGDDVPDSDALRYHIHVLRKAVDGPFSTPLLHTVPGIGYRLCEVDELH